MELYNLNSKSWWCWWWRRWCKFKVTEKSTSVFNTST